MSTQIGITTYFVKSESIGNPQLKGLPGQDLMISTMDYINSVKMAGGIPVPIPTIQDDHFIKEIVSCLDGFILSGGSDLNPLKFNQPAKRGLKKINPERDEFEFRLLEEILRQKKPILGICRGFQLINIFYGGTLYQDIKESNLTDQEHFCKMIPRDYPSHKLEIFPESKLFSLLKKDYINVNSYHHQAVNKLGKGLKVLGRSEDGLVELFEDQDYPFLLATQWHPEMMAAKDEDQFKIFELLIKQSN